ncbi:hypothetical protein CF165_39880 [Amycolatopsis vastitatis]|uniref:Uncharacterized protein n=1 Tax=Amycolatopsis vastitatis TaxID=1905142 RepID=A0A229SQA9_9PSEU|nr:hypothetical protein CF165_39880 [Amycolatopsis vastitatis]
MPRGKLRDDEQTEPQLAGQGHDLKVRRVAQHRIEPPAATATGRSSRLVQATAATELVWPVKVVNSSPVARSQTRAA